MCGRTGLALCAPDVQAASCYKCSKTNKYVQPQWVDEYNFGKQYSPSYNIAPTDVTPVLVSAKNFGIGNDTDRILKPMMWGMVPPWHKGDFKSHGLSTNNCRIENLPSSNLYSPSLRKGNRCVVLAEGFYEWKTNKNVKSKQPYYIYMPQLNDLKVENPTTWKNNFDEDLGWSGIKLLKMAAIYEEWSCEDGTLYSYSIITMESNDTLGWLHHRMPAILDKDEDVTDWLDSNRLPWEVAVSKLKPILNLSWHPVSNLVNNSRNKSPDCNKPVADVMLKSDETLAKSKNMMMSWLVGKRKSQASEDSCEESPAKKVIHNLTD